MLDSKMSREIRRKKLIQFLDTIRLPHKSFENVDDHDALVRSGLIDSLSVLQIINYLESEYSISFAEKGIDPGELSSIAKLLDLIEQFID